MEDYQYDKFTGLGVMPSGEIYHFSSEREYYEAYTDEESEMYDEMYRLNNMFEIEEDEDWLVTA